MAPSDNGDRMEVPRPGDQSSNVTGRGSRQEHITVSVFITSNTVLLEAIMLQLGLVVYGVGNGSVALTAHEEPDKVGCIGSGGCGQIHIKTDIEGKVREVAFGMRSYWLFFPSL